MPAKRKLPTLKHCKTCNELITDENKVMNGTYIKSVCKKCKNEYELKYRHDTGISGRMKTNDKCGVFLWEKAKHIIRTNFPTWIEMPQLTKHFNFIDDNGEKIAIRASVTLLAKNKFTPHWHFHVVENRIADKYIFMGFDSRQTLELIRAWIIPNNTYFKTIRGFGITTSEKSIAKWKKYEIILQSQGGMVQS